MQMDTTLLAKLYMDTTSLLIFLLAVEQGPQGVQFRFKSFNPAYQRLTELTEEIVGKRLGSDISERTAAINAAKCVEAIEKKQMIRYEELAHLSGNKLIVETVLHPFFDENGKPVHLLGVIRDITERKISEQIIRESEDRYRTLVQLSPDAILIIDDRNIIFNNEAAARMVGLNHPDEMLGRDFFDFIPEEQQRCLEISLKRMYSSNDRQNIPTFETKLKKTTGETLDVEGASAFVEYNGKMVLQVFLRDITKRKKERAQLERLSQLDGLTNVANRRHFDRVLKQEVNRARRNKQPLSLILFDIDEFKKYNDYYGHLQGDDCLKQITAAASKVLKRPGDLLARFGGEEFVVLLPETDLYGAEVVAEQLRSSIEQLQLPHQQSEVADHVTISLGVASMTRPSESDIIPLLERADRALYHAKRMGKNRVVAFPSP